MINIQHGICIRVEIYRMFLYLQLTLAVKVYGPKKITSQKQMLVHRQFANPAQG